MITLSKSKLLKFAELSELQIDGRSEFAYTNRLEHFAELVLSDLDVCMEHVTENGEPHQQLAAEQLNNKLLREALKTFITEHEECEDGDGCMAQMCSMEALHAADEALSTPFTPTALLELIEKVEKMTIERCAEHLSDVYGIEATRCELVSEIRALPTGQIKLEELP